MEAFGQVTFEWEASSFTSSSWNSSMATIIIQHYYGWAKTQPGMLWDEPSAMEKILERWVQGQGEFIKKASVQGSDMVDSQKRTKDQKAYLSKTKKLVSSNKVF